MSENKTTYESLDGKIAPEALLKDTRGKLQMVDGHGIKQEADYDDPDKLYGMLIARIQKYHPSADVTQIEKAYNLAKKAHGDQKRKSGEPYIIHPLWVAIILADLEMDKETIIAALLHDVVEDTQIGEDYIKEEFGEEVALLVDGVTKLGRVAYSADKLELQAENLRKMFLAMAKDIRVIIIKLADRLHNMRTLQFMTPAKQQEKARETMDIYAPIAGRLGISKIKTELDDLSLKYLKPDVFFDLVCKSPKRKLCTLVALCRCCAEIAEIAGQTADTENTAAAVQVIINLLRIHIFLFHQERNNCRVNLAAACAHNQALKRCIAHARINRFTVFDCRDAGTVTQMAADDTQIIHMLLHQLRSTQSHIFM